MGSFYTQQLFHFFLFWSWAKSNELTKVKVTGLIKCLSFYSSEIDCIGFFINMYFEGNSVFQNRFVTEICGESSWEIYVFYY